MDLTWVALLASLMMGLGAACVFIFAVKRSYFHDLENAKYQVFWSDLHEMVEETKETDRHGGASKDRNQRGKKCR